MHLDEFLLATVVLLAATAVFVSLFKRLGVGSILGFLAAGVLLGPSGVTLTKDVEGLRHFTELGVVLFLFLIGLEIQPTKLWSMRKLVLGLGSLQVLVTGGVIGGYLLLVGVEWRSAVILGFGFALSSTAFVMQLLGERGELSTEHGESSFAILLTQDMAIVPLLALVPLLSATPGGADVEGAPWLEAVTVVGAIAGVVLVGRYLIPMALTLAARSRNQEAFVSFAMLAALGAAYAMELVGVSMALGAFLMGMMLSASDYRHQIEATVEPFKGLLIGLFFVSVGMSIDLELLADEWARVVRAVAAFLTMKVVTLLALGLLFGLARAAAIRTAFILCQCGEFGFVLFGAAFAAGLLSEAHFGLALMLVTVTMIVTPLMARAGDALAERFGVAPARGEGDEAPGQGLKRHVVIAGYGRGGGIVGLMLENNGIPYIAFDIDTDRVAHGRGRGRSIHFGDLADPKVLGGAGLSDASAVVVTLEDPHLAEKVIRSVRLLAPSVPVFSRAADFKAEAALMESGVTRVVPQAPEAAIQLGAAVLQGVGVADSELETLIESVRRNDYALLRSAEVG